MFVDLRALFVAGTRQGSATRSCPTTSTLSPVVRISTYMRVSETSIDGPNVSISIYVPKHRKEPSEHPGYSSAGSLYSLFRLGISTAMSILMRPQTLDRWTRKVTTDGHASGVR